MDKVGKVAARAEVGEFMNQLLLLLLPERCDDYGPNTRPVAGGAAFRAAPGRQQTKASR